MRFKRKYELYHQGIVTFKDIIEKRPKMGAKQMEQVETAYYHKPDVINREEIKEFINTLYYPIYHLDFDLVELKINFGNSNLYLIYFDLFGSCLSFADFD